jgi:hypothetical protein
MVKLGQFINSKDEQWSAVIEKASVYNPWFTPAFIHASIRNITDQYLNESKLNEWLSKYSINDEKPIKNIGIVMAGNIPLVGFHDFLCVFLAGHRQTIQFSSKDNILLPFLIETIKTWQSQISEYFVDAPNLKGCDAYIATGGNRSSIYFEQYFSKYPNIIRKNRTSVAFLTGEESKEELDALADDVHMYFGLGCRNVTQIKVPINYDFIPLINAFKSYASQRDVSRYSNNYDYQLSLILLNQTPYMSSDGLLLIESDEIFSPISVLHYTHYTDLAAEYSSLIANDEVQCIVGKNHTPFGTAQCPKLDTYADGIDTMRFLLEC